MQVAQRGGSIHSSIQGTVSFRGNTAESVASQLNMYQEKYAVRVVAMAVLVDPLPKPKDGAVVLIVTLQED